MASHLPSLTLKLALLDRGIESFQIEFDSQNCVFAPGDTLHGHVLINLKDAIKARAVVMTIVARARSRWTLWEQYSSNRSTHSEAIPYSSEEVYMDQEKTVWQGRDVLPAGIHRFPFVFTLPTECPPSFEGTIGFIRYYCKAKIDRPWKFDDTTRQAFTVLPNFDLNTIYYASMPMVKPLSKPIGMLCFNHGVIEAKISLSKSGYVPGENVVLSVEINNNSSKNIARVETALLEIVTYTAKRGKPIMNHYGFGHRHSEIEKKQEVRTVVQYIEDFKVPKNSHSSYMRMLAIPPIVPSFNVCSIIQVDYQFKVKIITKGGIKRSVAGELPILIGTIPVRHSVVPQQRQTVHTPDYLIPPKPSPSIPSVMEANPPPSFVECIFGKGTVEENNEDKLLSFTPKYIYYSGLKS